MPRRIEVPPWAVRLALAACIAGLAVRAWAAFVLPDAMLRGCDGRINWNIATNLAAGRGYFVDDPYALVPHCLGQATLGPSHHYSPLLPTLEAAAILLAGPDLATLHAAVFAVSVAAVAAVYLATRDLFGPAAAALATAFVSADWTLVLWGTRYGFAESLVHATFTLTLWAILRSVRQPRAILWAGLFAGLGYLSKASAGWFFLLAAAGGLAWRLRHHGWAALRDRWYLAAGGIFLAFLLAWSLRNVALFWDGTLTGLATAWQTSPYTSSAVAAALGDPAEFARGLALRFPVLLLALVPFAPLWPELRDAWAAGRREDASALWLGAGLVFGLGWLFAASFFVAEGDPYYWLQPVRYVAPAAVPLLWLVLGYSERPFSFGRWAAAGALLVAIPMVVFRFYRGAG